MEKKNAMVEVFGFLEPEVLKGYLLKMLKGFIYHDETWCEYVDAANMVVDLVSIVSYLNHPEVKEDFGILETVNADKLTKYLIRLHFGYLKSIKDSLSEDHNRMFADISGIFDQLLTQLS
jgi:hypothetical protein